MKSKIELFIKIETDQKHEDLTVQHIHEFLQRFQDDVTVTKYEIGVERFNPAYPQISWNTPPERTCIGREAPCD